MPDSRLPGSFCLLRRVIEEQKQRGVTMAINVAVLRAMAKAGAGVDAIIAAVEAQQTVDAEAQEVKRRKDRDRQRRLRLSQRQPATSRDTTDELQAVVAAKPAEPQDVACAGDADGRTAAQKEGPHTPKEILQSSSFGDLLEPRGSENTRARCSSDAKSDGWPADFREQFWAAYPRKVEKLAAFRALSRVRKSGKVAWSTVLMAVHRYAKTVDPEFTKHPPVWLNKGCWDDEMAVARLARAPPAKPIHGPAAALLKALNRKNGHAPKNTDDFPGFDIDQPASVNGAGTPSA